MAWLKTLILEKPRIVFPTSCMMEAKSVGTEGKKGLKTQYSIKISLKEEGKNKTF